MPSKLLQAYEQLLAAFGLLNPVIAGAAMAMSSVSAGALGLGVGIGAVMLFRRADLDRAGGLAG